MKLSDIEKKKLLAALNIIATEKDDYIPDSYLDIIGFNTYCTIDHADAKSKSVEIIYDILTKEEI